VDARWERACRANAAGEATAMDGIARETPARRGVNQLTVGTADEALELPK
jgi:hypothetical protein